jgi:NAD(P)-dependent dehydrogenase (short-subunit alcohol dehydrogenase family)
MTFEQESSRIVASRGVVAVTGAAGALGLAVCSKLACSGYAVIGIDVAREIPRSAQLALSLTSVDLTSSSASSEAFSQIESKCGSLAALVNLAGGFVWETVEQGSLETWDHMYNMNVRTAFNAIKAALPLLLVRRGVIVNVGAMAASRAGTGMGAYAASKSAVARLTESLAAELLSKGVRVNAVLPSVLDTPSNRASMPQEAFDRWVTTEALAEVIAFLISNPASAITGALIPVTGGL